jgi:hypothetical protein
MKHGPKMAPVYDVSWSTFGSPEKMGVATAVYGFMVMF